MNILSSTKQNQIISFISILIGVILVIYPIVSLNYIVVLLGGILILTSLISIVEYYKVRKSGDLTNSIMFNSVIVIIIGCFLVISPLFFIRFILIVLAILLLLGSLSQIISLLRSRGNYNIPAYLFIVPVLLFVCSLIMLFAPINSVATVIRIFGYGIIIYSVLNLYSYYTIKKKNISMN